MSAAPAVSGEEALRREARILSRYLLDRECPGEMQERYARGTRVLHRDSGGTGDPVARFAMRHPAALPCLDAAAALTRRGGVLRDKLLLMTAVLETSPQFATEFLPRTSTLPRALLLGAWAAVKTIALALLGLPLMYAIAARR